MKASCKFMAALRATNDDALKAMSVRVLEARPDFVLAWRLRGEVLCARLGDANWEAAPRSSLELAEAGIEAERNNQYSAFNLGFWAERDAPLGSLANWRSGHLAI